MNKLIQVAIDSPAAAGAGTQAKLLAKHYNLFYFCLLYTSPSQRDRG